VAACSETGVSARFLVGRLDRGSCDVGMDSGIGSDIVLAMITDGSVDRESDAQMLLERSSWRVQEEFAEEFADLEFLQYD
jgi:hypothetical protein